jgi:hypothetical protein
VNLNVAAPSVPVAETAGRASTLAQAALFVDETLKPTDAIDSVIARLNEIIVTGSPPGNIFGGGAGGGAGGGNGNETGNSPDVQLAPDVGGGSDAPPSGMLHCGPIREAARTDTPRNEVIAERLFVNSFVGYGDATYLPDGSLRVVSSAFPTADQGRFEGNKDIVDRDLWFLSEDQRFSLSSELTDRGVNATHQKLSLIDLDRHYSALGKPNGTSQAAFAEWVAQQAGGGA